jgi:hypothetical protein
MLSRLKSILPTAILIPASLMFGQEPNASFRVTGAYTEAFGAPGGAIVLTIMPNPLKHDVTRGLAVQAGVQLWGGKGEVARVDFNTRELVGVGASIGLVGRPTLDGVRLSAAALPQFLFSDPGAVLTNGGGTGLPSSDETDDKGFALGFEAGVQVDLSHRVALTTDLAWISHRLYGGGHPGIWRFGLGLEFRPGTSLSGP